MGKRQEETFINGESEMANENMKKCSISSAIKDMQIELIMRYYLISSRMDK